jgi:hypothetical protein
MQLFCSHALRVSNYPSMPPLRVTPALMEVPNPYNATNTAVARSSAYWRSHLVETAEMTTAVRARKYRAGERKAYMVREQRRCRLEECYVVDDAKHGSAIYSSSNEYEAVLQLTRCAIMATL